VVSKGWIQAVILVMLVGFFILGLLAYRTYMAQPPVPQRVVDAQGRVLYTGNDVSKGQQVFLHNGLMEYGSAFGHGAYLGPDFTADYLRRASEWSITVALQHQSTTLAPQRPGRARRGDSLPSVMLFAPRSASGAGG
jgi:nitric oxide reductase subunit B